MTVVVDAEERRAVGPYKFLDFYEEQDKHKFAGRERDMREVVARICANRTFVLYAPSGLGKTSLLLAGVFPVLRDRRFTPIYVRTLQDPLRDLYAAVSSGLACGPIETFDGLAAALEEHSARTTVVLVFDQFEEFFIHFRGEPRQRAAFVSSVATLAGMSALNLRLVFSLREDYLAELDEFRDEVSDLFANDYRLRRLTAFGARQAIAQPLIVSGVQYDRRLLVRLVDLLADVGFDPVMLQILCAEVYRISAARSAAGARMTEADLEQAGGLDGVVRRYLDRVVAAIPKNSVLLSRTVLDALITQEKTKRAVTFETLVSADFSASREELERILGIFMTHRLLRAERRGTQMWYELSHERLVQPVLDWLKLDRDFFNFRVARDLVANSCSGEVWRSNVETLLAEGPLIHVIGPYAMRLRFAPLELEFIYRSAVYRRTDPRYWASLIGQPRCAAILLEYLAGDSAQARAGAAHAAAALPDPDGRLGDACLRVALHDPEAAVRRAAGAALATLATDAHLADIAAAVRARPTRGAALEVLADLRQQRRELGRFGLWSRLRARYIANRRVRREHAESIRQRGKQGALTGLLTSIAWTGLVAVPAFVVLTWATGSSVSFAEVGVAGFLLILALGVGTLLGWRVGRVAAIEAAMRGGSWFRAVMRLRVQYSQLAILLVGSLTGDTLPYLAEVGLAIIASGLTWQVVTAVTARTARDAVWPRVATRAQWAWALAASAGLPLLLAGLALWALTYVDDTGELSFMVALAAAVFSLGAAVAVNTLAQAPVSGATPDVPPARRRTSQIRLALLLASVMAWTLLTYGFDSFPFFASTRTLSAGQPVEIDAPLRRGLADSAYFSLASQAAGIQWFNVASTPSGAEAVIDGTRLEPGHIVAVPTGRAGLVIRGVGNGEAQKLRLEPLPADGPVPALTRDRSVVAIARFRQSSEDAGLWTATIEGTVQETSSDLLVVVAAQGFSAAEGVPRVELEGVDMADTAGTLEPLTVRVVEDLSVFPGIGQTVSAVRVESGRWRAPLQFRPVAGFTPPRGAAVDIPVSLTLRPGPL